MTAALDMIRGRSNIVTMTNNSGGGLVAGDVCVQDTSADENVTTTTSAASTLKVFVAAETIAAAAAGKFYESGYCPLVNVSASATRGYFLFTHTVAKQATTSATYGAGAFGKVLKAGTTPSAIIYSQTAQIGSGVTRSGSTTDAHLAVWNGSNADSLKDGGVPASGGASTADPFVIGAGAAGDLSTKVQISGLTGSADINGAAGAGTSEEFDGADPFTYSAALTATDTNTTIKSHWYAQDSAGTAKYCYKAWAPAGAFDARWKMDWACDDQTLGNLSIGVWIGDSANSNGVIQTIDILQNSPREFTTSAYTVATGAFTQRGVSHLIGCTTIYFRITRDGSNNVSFYWSTNGHIWVFVATQNFTLTVARIGFRLNSVTGGKSLYVACDWLRTSV